MIAALTFTIWDTDSRRGASLKERLDMFTERENMLFSGEWTGTPCNDVCFLSFDDCSSPVMNVAQSVRRNEETVFILLISDRDCELTTLFRPKIRPSGVIFRPVKNAHLREMLDEIVDEIDRLSQIATDDVFILKSDGISRRIPFRDILFFEANNKKVILHTAGQEISYYTSIDNLTGVLPPHFIRCHRGFLVNIHKIEELRGADMELTLTGGVRIPFSRSQRETVEQAMSRKSRTS